MLHKHLCSTIYLTLLYKPVACAIILHSRLEISFVHSRVDRLQLGPILSLLSSTTYKPEYEYSPDVVMER